MTASEPACLSRCDLVTRHHREVPGEYFQRVQWLHSEADEPVVLWAHIHDGWEVRKVDEFSDGRMAWADQDHEAGSTRLGQVPMPSPSEIASDEQFLVEVVSEAAFEQAWARARARS